MLRGGQNERDLPGPDLWAMLDAWEPEPISPDFNRRLYRRIARFERGVRRVRIIVPLVGFLIIATIFTAATREPQTGPFHPGEPTQCQSKVMAQTLSDLGMLTSLSSTKPL